ncbi:MAG: hypothetical protein OEV08_07065 [Nitrospira sp.]|nr:hypothetical protein [Nitrospira sp.]
MTAPGKAELDSTYEHLLGLWTSGVRDYHTMLSDYLTANSIFVAVIGLILSRELVAVSFTVLILLLCIFGILLCLQMAIVLGRLSGRNALWEWRLRGIEQDPRWHHEQLMSGLYRLHETRQPMEDRRNEPPVFQPNWAFRQHRQWWAHRAISFPWFFGSVYAVLLVWSMTQLLNA